MYTIEEQLAKLSIPVPSLPRIPRTIPIFGRDAASRIQALTKKYQLRGADLRVALVAIYFSHQELWHPDAQGARASTRSAAKVHFAVNKLMSVISEDVTTLAELLNAPAVAESLASAMAEKFAGRGNRRAPAGSAPTMGDVSTLMVLLRRLLINSAVAKKAKSARGRGRNPLAVTVAEELGQHYDKCCPLSALERAPRRTRTVSAPRPRTASPKHRRAPSSGRLEGESRSNIRATFVREAAGMLGIRVTVDTILTYRKKEHLRRIRS